MQLIDYLDICCTHSQHPQDDEEFDRLQICPLISAVARVQKKDHLVPPETSLWVSSFTSSVLYRTAHYVTMLKVRVKYARGGMRRFRPGNRYS